MPHTVKMEMKSPTASLAALALAGRLCLLAGAGAALSASDAHAQEDWV